jgi:ABC-2 type transport system ATP-binding protein
MSIEVKNLSKVYGEQKAVNDISFAINKGEIVGFLGPNGAGKSTTMKIITGYLQSDGGETTVCGINVKEQPEESKKKIGYLPEANPLYMDMYVREYLDFVAEVHQVKNKKQKIEEVITTVGLTPESKKKISQLSKGYKQRVGLAAALIHEPEVLILDEPTSGLDPNQIIEIRDVVKKLGQQKTILFSSHILQEVEAICDRVIIINKGNIVADDLLKSLKAKNTGAALVKLTLKEKAEKALFTESQYHSSINTNDGYHFTFETEKPDELKKWILSMSLQKNMNIVSILSEIQSLEDVFRQLTQTSQDDTLANTNKL